MQNIRGSDLPGAMVCTLFVSIGVEIFYACLCNKKGFVIVCHFVVDGISCRNEGWFCSIFMLQKFPMYLPYENLGFG